MRRNLTYVPKERKTNYYLVVLLLFVVVLGGVGLYIYMNQEEDLSLYYTFCDLTPKQTQNILEKRQKEYNTLETIEVEDYGLYGETLKLYQKPYKIGKVDGFSGNTLFLSNLCNTTLEDKSPFLMSSNLDIGIDIDQLNDGLYEVEILSDFKFKRLRSDEAIDETFYSAKKNGIIKKVRIFSESEILNAGLEEDIIKDDYFFIEVTSIEDNDEVDVVLNPSRFTENEYGIIDMGHFYGDIEEATETYKMAEKVKSYLEKQGVRVKVLRDDETPIDNFSTDGRVVSAYNMHAKYMVNMRYESSGAIQDYGLVVLYPEFTSNRFAANLAKKLLNETSLRPSPYEDFNNPSGVFESYDRAPIYYSDMVRETGGFLTGAGTYEDFKELGTVTKDLKYGMNTIDVIYGYMTHPEDLKTWQTEFDLIAEKTAEAILIQMGVMGD